MRGRGRGVRWGAAAVLVAAGLTAVTVARAPEAQAAEVPWVCSDNAYLFQSPNANVAPHDVIQVDLATGANVNIGDTGDQVNAVGFNPLDDFMYGWNLQANRPGVVRISADHSLTDLGVPAGLPAGWATSTGFNVGEVDDQGDLWIMDNQNGRWAQIDLTPGSATYNTVVSSGTSGPPSANLVRPGDWAEVGDVLYGVAPVQGTGTQPAQLVSFSRTTHTFAVVGALPAIMQSGSTYGAVYSDGASLFASRNQGGAIFRVDVGNLSAVRLATGPVSSSNDGARCRSRLPTMTVAKQVLGRLAPSDQFTVALLDAAGDPLTHATTSGAQTQATSDKWTVERGHTYTITDELAPGSTSLAGSYTADLTCRDAATNSLQPVTSAGAGLWHVTVGTTINDYVCTVTNDPDDPAPALSLTKSGTLPGGFVAGAVVDYAFVVRNTGNVTVHGVTVDETAFSGTGTPPVAACDATTLSPGDETVCTAQYTITQADVDAGALDNTAQAHGLDPSGGDVTSNEDSFATDVAPDPALTLAKSAEPAVVTRAGEEVTYDLLVTNTGNVTLTGVAVTETAFSGTGTPIAPTCPLTTLLPGRSTTCTATYTVTQDDVDAGEVTNTAFATGTPPAGGPVDSDPDTAVVTVATSPELTIEKVVDPEHVTAAGETVEFTFTVTNVGNVTLHDVAIVETSFTGTGVLPAATCGATTLAPGDGVTCTSTYEVTQADVDAGVVTNVALATGVTPDGDPVQSNDDDAVVGVVATVSLSLVKTVAPATVARAGDTVTYTFVVTNTGNSPATDVHVVEPTFTGTGTAPTVTCGPTASSLAPGAKLTCTSTYTVTQADVDAGSVLNVARAEADGPDGPVASLEDDAVVTAPAAPALALAKSASPATVTGAGQQITYDFVVTNTGNVTITDVAVDEVAFGGSGTLSAVTCPAGAGSLAPGGSVTCHASYVVSAADAAAGSVANTALATGVDPGGSSVESAQDDAVVTVATPAPSPSPTPTGPPTTAAPTPPPSAGALPQTGADSAPVLVVAAALALAGLLLLAVPAAVAARRRR